MKYVECYCPILNSWELIAELSISRSHLGIAVLDDVMYAIGGISDLKIVQKSVEAYTISSKVWTPIADMHLHRYNPGNKNHFFSNFIEFKLCFFFFL